MVVATSPFEIKESRISSARVNGFGGGFPGGGSGWRWTVKEGSKEYLFVTSADTTSSTAASSSSMSESVALRHHLSVAGRIDVGPAAPHEPAHERVGVSCRAFPA